MESNFAVGIVRMMNNKALYVRLLTKFKSTDNIASLDAAIKAGDMDLIKMEAHTLKGVAANLALDGLSAKAAALDLAVKEGRVNDIEELFNTIKESYTVTMAEIEVYISEE